MTHLKKLLVRFLTLAVSAFLVISFSPPVAHAAGETINVWTDSGNDDEPLLKPVAVAFEKANPSVHVIVNVGPTGDPAVQLGKEMVANGTKDDVFVYYAGSLFQGLDPTRNLVELTDEPWQSNVPSSYYPGVSIGTHIYGAPFGSAMGIGILYNNAKIKKAGLIPVIQTYADSWSAQLFILADAFNVQVAVPTFAALYTANRVKIAKVPAALPGFQHLADVHKAKYQNKDYATAKLADGLKYLISGQGVQYPMLSFVAMNAALAPSGPYMLKGVQLSGHVSHITIEMQRYFKAEGKTALQGATSYDLDVSRESARLGLPGWGKLPG